MARYERYDRYVFRLSNKSDRELVNTFLELHPDINVSSLIRSALIKEINERMSKLVKVIDVGYQNEMRSKYDNWK